MLPFLETIAVSEGHYLNLPYHNKRYNATLLRFFNSIPEHSLADLLPSPPKSNELMRCRVTYNLDQFKVEFLPYVTKEINTLQCINDNNFTYDYKYNDRTQLNLLLSQRGLSDEILIIKNNLVTDLSIANIIFQTGNRIVTPNQPLLLGTSLLRMIDEGIVYPVQIGQSDLKYLEGWQPINAMRPFNKSNWRSMDTIYPASEDVKNL